MHAINLSKSWEALHATQLCVFPLVIGTKPPPQYDRAKI